MGRTAKGHRDVVAIVSDGHEPWRKAAASSITGNGGFYTLVAMMLNALDASVPGGAKPLD